MSNEMTAVLRIRRVLGLFAALAAVVSAGARADGAVPIVFAHGLGITGQAYEMLGGLKRFFRDRDRPFFIALTPAGSSIEKRTEILKAEIARLVPGNGPIHLVAHSMGGLDCRLALEDPAIAARVLSLTTLSTPHHGSPVADFVMRNVDQLETSRALRGVVEKLFGGDLEAVRELTVEGMDRDFNPRVPDVAGVQYFSMGFYIPWPAETHSLIPWLWATHGVISRAGFPLNDGMVSRESALWGQDLGMLPGDHYSETSPIPLIGGADYRDVFGRVLGNIEKRVENAR